MSYSASHDQLLTDPMHAVSMLAVLTFCRIGFGGTKEERTIRFVEVLRLLGCEAYAQGTVDLVDGNVHLHGWSFRWITTDESRLPDAEFA